MKHSTRLLHHQSIATSKERLIAKSMNFYVIDMPHNNSSRITWSRWVMKFFWSCNPIANSHFVYERRNHKLFAKYYGPYSIVEKFGKVAYKLELHPGARIHNIFHCITTYIWRRLVQQRWCIPICQTLVMLVFSNPVQLLFRKDVWSKRITCQRLWC